MHTPTHNTQRQTHTFTNRCLIKHKKASKLQSIKWIITDYTCTHLQIKPPDCQAKQSGHDSSKEKQQPICCIIINVHTLHLKEKHLPNVTDPQADIDVAT